MKKRSVLKWVAGLCIAVLAVAGAVIAYQAIPVGKADLEIITLDTDVIRVGILSDNQLGQEEAFEDCTRDALQFLKDQEVDMLINVGDFTDLAFQENYETYQSIYQSVYGTDPDNQPITSYQMGNHDYWLSDFVDCWEIPFHGKLQRRFMNYTGEDSPWTHKVINGYHFIGVSPTNGGMDASAYSDSILDWAEEQIQLALEQDPDKPVFVMTHHHPAGTLYMSGEDGATNLTALFSKYPQVISISGHSHAPLMDERAIWQEDFTAINTQTVAYMCLSAEDSDLVHDSGEFVQDNPMVMIMEISDAGITVQRYSTDDGSAQKEPWTLPLNLNKETFTYTTALREEAAQAPAWDDGFELETEAVERTEGSGETRPYLQLRFTAATHPDLVQAYELEFLNEQGEVIAFQFQDGETVKTRLSCASDYALRPDQRSGTVRFNIPLSEDSVYRQALPAGTYTVNIWARESFGKRSEVQSGQITIP